MARADAMLLERGLMPVIERMHAHERDDAEPGRSLQDDAVLLARFGNISALIPAAPARR